MAQILEQPMKNYPTIDCIRQAVIEDLEEIAQIETLCFPLAEAAKPEALKARIQRFPDSFFVAEKNGYVIGFINGAVTDQRTIQDEMFEDVSLHNPYGSYQSIFGLDVVPCWQHQGVAGELMRHMMKNAKQSGRKGLILTCKEGLIGFYEQFGYKNMGISASVHGGAVWYDMILEF